MITGNPLGTVDGFSAATDALHEHNAVVAEHHASAAAAAVEALPANRVPVAADPVGGDHDGHGAGR